MADPTQAEPTSSTDAPVTAPTQPVDRQKLSDDFFNAALEQGASSTQPAKPQAKGFKTQLEQAMAGDDAAFDTPPDDNGAVGENQLGASVLSGAAKAFFETKDTIAGVTGLGDGSPGNLGYEPKFEDKSSVRNAIETSQALRERDSLANGVARSTAQFVTGMAGLGKVVKGTSFAANAIRGALTGAIAFDPHEERLSNFLNDNVQLVKPVTQFLAADPNDSGAVGRLKAAAESLILDVTVTAAFVGSIRVMKLFRDGKKAEAQALQATLDDSMAKASAKGLWPTESIDERLGQAWERASVPPKDAGHATDAQLGDAWQENVSAPAPQAPQPGGAWDRFTAGVKPTEEHLAEGWEQAVKPHQDQALGDAWERSVAEREATLQRAKEEDSDITRQAVQDGYKPKSGEVSGFPGDSPQGAVRSAEPAPPAGAPEVNVQGGAKRAPDAATDGAIPGGGDTSISPGGKPKVVASASRVEQVTQEITKNKADLAQAQANGQKSTASSLQSFITKDEATLKELQGSKMEVVPGEQPRAQARPPEAEPITFTEENMAQLRKDDAAITKHGTVQDAIDAGYVFKGRGAFPWQKVNTAEGLEAFMGQVLETNKGTVEKARGGSKVTPEGTRVMSDAEVDKLADRWVKVYNEDPAFVRQVFKNAGEEAKQLAGRMEAAMLVSNRMMADTYELARLIDAGNFTGFGSRGEAEAALKWRLGASIESAASARAMVAAAGRTMRRMRTEFRIRGEALAKVNSQVMDPDALVTAILATKGDPTKMATISTKWGKLLVDYVGGQLAAGFLWAPFTHVVNFGTGAANLMWRPLEAYAGGAALGAKAVVRGDEGLRAQAATVRHKARLEATQTAYQIADAWHAAKEAFMAGESRITPHAIEVFTDQATQLSRVGLTDLRDQLWKPVDSVGAVLHNAWVASNIGLAMPLRLTGAADELVRVARYRSVVAAKATLDAEEMGLKPRSKEFAEYVDKRVQESFDEHGQAIDGQAAAEAKETVFGQDMLKAGTEDTNFGWQSFGATMQNAAVAQPLLRWIVPFIRTPTNLYRYGIKLTPGLNLLQAEYRNAFMGSKGVEAQARAVGQMALGSLLVAQAIQMRYEGRITGAGPLDSKSNKEWRAEGNMPYSLVTTDKDGKKHYTQLNRFDPIQFPFTLAATATELLMQRVQGRPLMGMNSEDSDVQSIAASVVLAIAHQFRDKTYVKQVGDFLEMITDDNKFEPNLKRMLPNFMPAASLNRNIAQAGDPIMHEAYSYLDHFKVGLPGYSSDVAPRYNAFGEPVKIPGKMFNSQAEAGPLARALDTMVAVTGNTILPMSTHDPHSDADLRAITTADGRTAYDKLQDLSRQPMGKGQTMRQALDALVQTPAYLARPHGKTADKTRDAMVADVVSKYRNAARQRLMTEDKPYREAIQKRAIAVQNATVAGAKNLQVEAARGAAGSLNSILQPYGLSMPTPPSMPQQ